MKKALAVVLIGLVGCSGMLLCDVAHRELVIRITQEQIQKRLDSKFPVSKRYLAVFDLTLADPRVAMPEGSDRVFFSVSAQTNVRVDGKDLTGTAGIASRIRYKPEDGSLVLSDPQVSHLTISLVPEEYRTAVLDVARLAAREFLDGYEVYRLDTSDSKQALARLVLKDVVVDQGDLKIRLGPR
jgi:hypothetical protein